MTEPLDPFVTDDPVASIVAEHRRLAHERRPLLLRTSGTSTGRPREIVRTTASWVDSFSAFSELTGTDAGATVWIPGPLGATMNLFAATHTAWAGAERVGQATDASHLHLTTAAALGVAARTPELLTGRTVVVAGDALSPGQADALEAAGARVAHYYGAAELSFVGWGRDSESLRPFPGVEVHSDAGTLRARSAFLSLSARPDEAGWGTVGDLGEVTPTGMLRVFGRPGAVTTAGATVQLAEIEAALRIVAPLGVVVLGLPHPDLGAVLVAYVTDAAVIPALKEQALRTLTPAARPRHWRPIPAWPLTPQAKIDRVALAALT